MGSRKLDKIDVCLIPLIYLFRLTLTLVSTTFCIPHFVYNTINNGATWTSIVCIHIILFALRWLHFLARIPVNFVLQNPISQVLLYWPKFYWHLFEPDPTRRSIWTIVTNPIPAEGPKAQRARHSIPCLNSKYYCHSFFQVHGAYAHLHQKHSAYLFRNDSRNIFIRYNRKRIRLPKPLPTLHIKLFASKYMKAYTSKAQTDDNAFSWDTDGIPFIIDNSATGIITNVRKLFVGPLRPTRVTLETADGLSTTTKYTGTMRLVLTDDANKHHKTRLRI